MAEYQPLMAALTAAWLADAAVAVVESLSVAAMHFDAGGQDIGKLGIRQPPGGELDNG